MGVVSYDVHANARRLETAFPLHTEEGVRSFLDKMSALEELKYFSGDFDVVVWLADFYEVMWKVGLSDKEMEVLYFLYFEGYKQIELAEKLGIKKNTLHTLLTRATKKIADFYMMVKLLEEGVEDGTENS